MACKTSYTDSQLCTYQGNKYSFEYVLTALNLRAFNTFAIKRVTDEIHFEMSSLV